MSLTTFESLPQSSRIWIFAANRELSKLEATELLDTLDSYLSAWKAHGAPVRAARDFRYNRFLIIAADPEVTAPSGCSIDHMTRAIKDLGVKFNVDFFGTMNVYYRIGDSIGMSDRAEFKELANSGAVTPETIVFNNTLTLLSELESDWEISAAASWHGRLLPMSA